MAIALEGGAYVVCWTADGRRRFEYFDLSEWAHARPRFEHQVRSWRPACR